MVLTDELLVASTDFFRPKPVIPDPDRTIHFTTFHQGIGSEFKEFERDLSGRLVAPKGIQERVGMWSKHPHVFAWPRLQ